MPSPSRLSRRIALLGCTLGLAFMAPVFGRAGESGPGVPATHAVASVASSRAPIDAALPCPGCDDSNACTVDSCDTTTGTCRHDPLSCDDDNPCTSDECRSDTRGAGGCWHLPRTDGIPCDDANSCTLETTCSQGVCQPGVLLGANTPCDDGNPCTGSDVCNPVGHCSGTPLGGGAACDDGSACTRDDRCVPGTEGTMLCEGTAQDCSDGDLCTDDRCDPSTGQCLHPPVSCEDGNACTTNLCDPATGLCRRDNVDGSCSDGRFCTVDDFCSGGNCFGGAERVCPSSGCGVGSCDEDDDLCRRRDTGPCPPPGECYSYQCVNGACQIFNDTGPNAPCQPAHAPGSCAYGWCVRGTCTTMVTVSCDDGNPCTEDDCPSGSCANLTKADGAPCGDACHPGAICQSGVCSESSPADCDDGNPCTTDSCDPVGGCAHQPRDCNDGNSCTRDFCSSVTGECVHDPQSNIPCSGPGGDLCHRPVCQDGACTGFAEISCDDGNACTNDLCDPGLGGCVHRSDVCNDGNSCTTDVCSGAGACVYAPLPAGFPCSDNNACTVNDLCTGPVEARVCAGIGRNCDDGNPCTRDFGVAEEGTCLCEHAPIEEACCSNGAPLSCDDGNPCTADRCDPVSGCVHDGAAGPVKEICNGVDDDCDGLVDERETLMLCAVRPSIVRDSATVNLFTVMCRWTPACDATSPPVPEPIGPVWLSAADLFIDPGDNAPLPDPFAHCAEAIVENPARRMVTDTGVTFVFDPSGDGVCGTTGGGRAGLVRELADVPDGKLGRVCVKWRRPGFADTERCGLVLVRHDGATEPQPLQEPLLEDGARLSPVP